MSIKIFIYISLILFSLSAKCGQENFVKDMREPEFEESDRRYADVFRSLDGSWKGTFTVYRKIGGQDEKTDLPTHLDKAYLESLDLEIIDQIRVTQHYESISPYYQKVKIIDTYHKDNEKRVEESTGVNKVENGSLWCIVDKPTEWVVHEGESEGDHTIIWSRHELDPLRVEYFRETVLAKTYTIVGYGYYGDDDTDLTPITWFLGEYQRIQ